MILTQVLQQRGIPFRTGQKPGEIKLCCPFCPMRGESVDTRFRLGINVHKNIGHCYNCNYRSKSIASRLLKALKLAAITIEPGMEEDLQAAAAIAEPVVLPEGFHPLTTVRDELDKLALNYIRQRGVSSRQILSNKIGATFIGYHAYRVVFPVYEGKELRGIVTRALNANMKPRYLNNTGDKYLYNFRPSPTLVLLEGVFKALRVERVLRHLMVEGQACALLGHDITDIQLEQIQKAKVETVVLWVDPDSVGSKGMLGVAEKLRPYLNNIEFIIPQQPADEEPPELLIKRWQQRVPLSWSVSNRLLTAHK